MRINTILVVEDNPSNQLLIEQQLSMLGYNVELVGSGEHALEILQPNKFDILMTDINMPGMDGFELTKMVRSQKNTDISSIPIIAITADVTIEDEEKCRSVGIDAFITKPVDINYLKDFLLELERNDGKINHINKQTIEKSEMLRFAQDERRFHSVILDISGVSEFVGGNMEMVCKLLAKFMEQTPESIEVIKDACLANDATSLINACHKLKSSARSVGAHRLADLCTALEAAGKEGLTDKIQDLGLHIEQVYRDTETAIVAVSRE